MTTHLFATTTTTTQDTELANWRVLPKPNENEDQQNGYYADTLSQRTSWNPDTHAQMLELYQNLIHCRDSYIASAVQQSLTVIQDAIRLYGAHSVIVSFNGGKDAVVVLYLVLAVMAHVYEEEKTQQSTRYRPRLLYFENDLEFPELLDFLQHVVNHLDLDMIAFEHETSFPQGLKVLTKHNTIQSVKLPMAFVLGTRDTDPNAGNQERFAPSSSYMPPFMRVNPILEWSYGQVWHFLRAFDLQYCSLYDQGYTSLGTIEDTRKCPGLQIHSQKYWPAYMLRDWDQERAGRIPKSSNSTDVSDDTQSTTSSYGSGVQTAAALIIGDEILKGYTADTNTQTAARALKNENIDLKYVVVVSDSIEDIVKEIRRLQELVDVVITSGGVGPTHDDVTVKAIAQAMYCEMQYNEEMGELLKRKMNTTELSDAQLKMATLPKFSKLRHLSHNRSDWPVLQCKKCFVLPGVPEYFGHKIQHLANYLSCQQTRSKAYKVVLKVDENSIVPILNEVVGQYPSISFGSYPFVSHPDYKTVITVEERITDSDKRASTIFDRSELKNVSPSTDGLVQLALDDLIQKLPLHSVLRVDNDMTMF